MLYFTTSCKRRLRASEEWLLLYVPTSTYESRSKLYLVGSSQLLLSFTIFGITISALPSSHIELPYKVRDFEDVRTMGTNRLTKYPELSAGRAQNSRGSVPMPIRLE